MLPVFLVGALTGELRRDLGFSEAEVGAALTILFVVAAVAAPIAGRVTERIGAAKALGIGVSLAACVAAAVGAWASTFWAFALPLAAVGIAIGLVDTGAARAFSETLSPHEQGRAFGFKEASVPAATMLAGLGIPTVAVPHGWRATFVATAAIAALVLLALSRFRAWGRRGPEGAAARARAPERGAGAGPAPADTERPAPAGVKGATVGLAAGVGVGAGAATSAAAFLVPALAARGIADETAGVVLSAASAASIAVRAAAGRWADRPNSRPTAGAAFLCVGGAAAAVALALPIGFAAAAVACLVLLGAGWGWTGLAFLAAVRANPGAPAAAAGVILSGLALGGALGPFAFGALAAGLSYSYAWAATAAALTLSAAAAYASRERGVVRADAGGDGPPRG